MFSLWLWSAGPTLPPRVDIRGLMGVCRTSLHVLCGFGEGLQPHPLGLLWGYVVLGLSRLWSTLLVINQIYSFCSSFLFAEFFFSEFAAEIEAARLKISYKSKTTVLRDGGVLSVRV